MKSDLNKIVAIAVTCSATLLGTIALTRNTDTKLDINLGKDIGSLTIEVRRSPDKTNDCLHSGKSSHNLDCNNR